MKLELHVTTIAFAGLCLVAGCGDAIDVGDGSTGHGTTETTDTTDTSAAPDTYNTVTSANHMSAGTGDSSTGDDNSTVDASTTEEPIADQPPEITSLLVNDDNDPSIVTKAGPVTLSVKASDDHELERVEFWNDRVDEPLAAIEVLGNDQVHLASWSLDHQDYNGTVTFWAVAVDDAGQESTSEEVALPVSLLPPGYNDPLTGTHDPLVAEVWSDVAVAPNGEFIIVGHRFEDGDDISQLVVERRSYDGDQVLDANFIPQPFPNKPKTAVAVAIADDGSFYVLAHVDVTQTFLGHYSIAGEQLDVWQPTGVQARDLVATQGRVIVTGNTGELGETDSKIRTWGFNASLFPWWSADYVGELADWNTGHAIILSDGVVVVAGTIMQDNQLRAGWIGAYDPANGEEQWTSRYGDNEEIRGIALHNTGYVTVGTVLTAPTRVRLRKVSFWGEPASDVYDVQNMPHDGDALGVTIAEAPGQEFVIGARSCKNQLQCQAVVRRYSWGAFFTSLLWHDVAGGITSTTTVTSIRPAPYGYTLVTGHGLVNLGQGPREQSWLDQYHP